MTLPGYNAGLEVKQSSAQEPFYNKLNGGMYCTFWDSDESIPFAPCLSFIFSQAGLDLSQIYSKFCPKYFQEFPKIFTYYSLSMSLLYFHYAPK